MYEIFIFIHVMSTTLVIGQLVYTIEEETEVGHLIGNLLIDSQLDQRYSREVLRSFRFRFLSTPSVDFLSVDEMTGNLVTTSRVDREAVCRSILQQRIRARRSHDANMAEFPRAGTLGGNNETDESNACVVQVDVAVQPLEHFRVIRCSIRIQDVNDNSPTFQPTHLVHELLESSQIGTGFVIPTARDLDRGRFGVAGYVLEAEDPRDDKFGLKTMTKMDGSTEVRLILIKSLDKETKDSHFLKVLAYDGGNPQKNGTLEVTVVVMDCNDNPPQFEQPFYEARATENSALETVVLRVLAHDADSGLNGEIVYGFAASTKTMYGNQFQVNPRSGEIKVIGSVDHEITHVCHLIVTATDRGNPPLQSEVPVKLWVEDVNDNRPAIVINTLFQADTDIASVSENAEPGTFVGHVIGSDADSGSNGRFNCSLIGGEAVYDHQSEGGTDREGRRVEHFRLRRMFNGEYNIITSTPIDREAAMRDADCQTKEDEVCFRLTVVCQDHGAPSLRSDKSLQVAVTDSNDNAPMFSRNIYRFELFENSPIGFPFAGVMATDADVGENGRISYSLVSSSKIKNSAVNGFNGFNGSEAMFSVDPDTGELSPSRTVDHEIIKNVVLQVIASDNGTPQLSTVATVHMKVIDVNDQPPVFTSGVFRFRLEENKPKDTEIGRVTAVDRDFPPYNKFRFQLSTSEANVQGLYSGSSGRPRNASDVIAGVRPMTPLQRRPHNQRLNPNVGPSDVFAIDPDSGVIRANLPLDREASPQHVLLVTAVDSQDPKLSSSATVLITVDDVNDNPPRFVYPSTSTATFIHSEPLLKGRTFVSLSARDPDADRNGEVRYFINKVLELHVNNRQPDDTSQETSRLGAIHEDKNVVLNTTKRKETASHLCSSERQIAGNGNMQFVIDSRSGRLTANEDFYIAASSGAGETLRNRTFAIEVVARDCGHEEQLESKTTLNLVIVKRIHADSRDGFLESRSVFFYGNIALSEESLSWTLVLCVVTAFIVIILLTAIALVGCRRDQKDRGAPVGPPRSHVNSATTYTNDGFRTSLLGKPQVKCSNERDPKRTFDDRNFNCWKALFRVSRRFRRRS